MLTVFNPNLPLDDSLMVAGEMRSQFNGLKTLIDEVPAGPPGPEGPMGPQGNPGEAGPQGPQGLKEIKDHRECRVRYPMRRLVSTVGEAIVGAARNPQNVGPFTGIFSEPPTQAELQDFAAYVETLRTALLRV